MNAHTKGMSWHSECTQFWIHRGVLFPRINGSSSPHILPFLQNPCSFTAPSTAPLTPKGPKLSPGSKEGLEPLSSSQHWVIPGSDPGDDPTLQLLGQPKAPPRAGLSSKGPSCQGPLSLSPAGNFGGGLPRGVSPGAGIPVLLPQLTQVTVHHHNT